MKRLLVGVLMISMILPFMACDKDSLVSNAEDVLTSFQKAEPLIARFLPNADAKIKQGLDIAGKLKDAIKASDSTAAVDLLGDLIPTFEDIVNNDIPQIKDVNTQTLLLAAFSLGDIGLSFLSNHLKKDAPQLLAASRHASKRSAIAEFAAKPVWGEHYKRK